MMDYLKYFPSHLQKLQMKRLVHMFYVAPTFLTEHEILLFYLLLHICKLSWKI